MEAPDDFTRISAVDTIYIISNQNLKKKRRETNFEQMKSTTRRMERLEELPSECIICGMDMEFEHRLAQCKRCSRLTHLACVRQWLRGDRRRGCPFCRFICTEDEVKR